MKKLRIVSVVGTRPEAVKIAPVIEAISSYPDLTHRLVATGQHDHVFADAIAAFGLVADLNLSHQYRNAASPVTAMETAIASTLMAEQPDLVLVQGDTNSAVGAARAAHRHGFPIGHIEAGLRTHNLARPFPEEQNRVEIARYAALHFAPSARAAQNLIDENICSGVVITGNPGIDALMQLPRSAIEANRRGIMVTCHRRENRGIALSSICAAILVLADLSGETITVPLHPNPNVSGPMRAALQHHPRINLIAPLAYPEMVEALQRTRFVVTDSGGLQEECAALGVPLLLMRSETERPEVVLSGNAILVGSDRERIVVEGLRLMNDTNHNKAMSNPSFPYGTGDAALRIVAAIKAHFGDAAGSAIGTSLRLSADHGNAMPL